MTIYIPNDINQTFYIIIYPNNTFLLTEVNIEKDKIMYIGKDRVKVEAMLRVIKKKAEETKKKNVKLMVYDMDEMGLKLNKQSHFYQFIPLY